MLVETELTLLDSFRAAHPDVHYCQVDDLHCLRWDGREVRDLSFAGMMARAWEQDRPPSSRRYPPTQPSPPPMCWLGLPDVEEGGLER